MTRGMNLNGITAGYLDFLNSADLNKDDLEINFQGSFHG